jgi:hypothetical protein
MYILSLTKTWVGLQFGRCFKKLVTLLHEHSRCPFSILKRRYFDQTRKEIVGSVLPADVGTASGRRGPPARPGRGQRRPPRGAAATGSGFRAAGNGRGRFQPFVRVAVALSKC